METLLNKKDC